LFLGSRLGIKVARATFRTNLSGRVRIRFPTRLETRTKESNVHASMAALKLSCEAYAKTTRVTERLPQWSPHLALGLGLEFEHVMLGPEKRRAMLG
jgi:hypothetical protein